DLMGAMGHIANAKWAAKVPNMPILLISGDMDPVGGMGKGVKKVDRFLENSGHTHVTFKLYPGARHEILNETNRKEVYADVLLFLEAVAAGGERE
ncbi:MAG: alpha/beta hydrolase, partial [Clostridia bacterium]|nr:alpha/beta hydrolase [Clostridia bacterium]